MQHEDCFLDFTEEDYEEMVNFSPIIQKPDMTALCFPLGTPIDFPIQEIVAENINPTNFIIRGLPSINGGELNLFDR